MNSPEPLPPRNPTSSRAPDDRLPLDLPVSTGPIAEENARMLLRRDCFRRFAELFAPAAAQLDFVQRIVLFGSVAAPLKKEVPRFAHLAARGQGVWLRGLWSELCAKSPNENGMNVS